MPFDVLCVLDWANSQPFGAFLQNPVLSLEESHLKIDHFIRNEINESYPLDVSGESVILTTQIQSVSITSITNIVKHVLTGDWHARIRPAAI